MPTIIHIQQQDLRDTSKIRWIELSLTSPRVIAPYAPCDPDQGWLAQNGSNPGSTPFQFWGIWSVSSNSVNLLCDDDYHLGSSAPPSDRGWRWCGNGDLQFVEHWSMTDQTVEVRLAAVLYDAAYGRRGRFPVPKTGDFGRGFSNFDTRLIRRGSFAWETLGSPA
jgi:hypothetical protein